MKRLSLLLAAIMLSSLALVACGGGAGASGSTGGTTGGGDVAADAKNIAVHIGATPETMDPALNSAADAASYIQHGFEGLLRRGENDVIELGQAAEMPTVSEDGTVYTFKLREDLKWSDGSPLTAADFEYSWKRAVAADTAAPYAELFNIIAGFDEANLGDGSALAVKALDDLTFEVTLANPCAYFLDLAAFTSYVPVQKATIEANGDAWATEAETYVSNGAFKMAEFVPSEYILYVKNENYWDADSIQLESLKFLLIEDDNASLNAYENGTAMLAKGLPGDEIPNLSQRDDYRLDPLQGTYYISFNNEKEPFNDVNVRKALSLAIDRDYMAETVMKGTYTAATAMVGPGVTGGEGKEFNEEGQKLNGGAPLLDTKANVEEAKKLMEAAGYSESNPLKFEYSTNDSAFHSAVAEALQQTWSEIYVDMTINVMEWSSFTAARRNGDYEVARDGWVNDYNDPSTLLDLQVSTNGNNNANYNNPAFDELMAKALGTDNQEERMAYMHEAEQMMLDDAAIAPIAYYAEFYLISPQLEGFYHSSLGYFYFMYCTVAA